jgi:hypothetical protein
MESELSKVNTSQCTFICRKLIHDKNSELLIAPIHKDLGVVGKIALFISWILLFAIPIYLMLTLNFNWYFEKL